jgi:molybdate transport system regulatory protein
MSKVWLICGAGRGVGKTRLAHRLCDVLPKSVYAKQGHGRAKRGKGPNFFHTVAEVEAFVAAQRRRREHIVVESNALARQGAGDVMVFVAAPADRLDVRRDAAALRQAADLYVGPGAERRRWQRVLRRLLDDAEQRAAIVDILADQVEFLSRSHLAVGTKVWFAANGKHAFGRGLAELLAEIDRAGSLRQAAESAGMSYRYAWQLIRSAQKHLGRSLILAHPGGSGGGGSALSLDGRRLMDVFRKLDADVADFAAKRFAKLYGKGTTCG